MFRFLFLSATLLYSWEMVGFTSTTTLPKDVKVWCYKNKQWYNNFNFENFPQISEAIGGEACWSSESIDRDLSIKNDTYEWIEGWNFVTPIYEDWDLDDKFIGNAFIGWRYENNEWKIYNYNANLNKFSTLQVGEGAFFYIPRIDMKINNLPLFCKDGKCSKIITKNREYKFKLKYDGSNNISFGFNLYRYSNNTNYKLGIGPFNKTTSKVSVCVEKEKVGGSCKKINLNEIISFDKDYVIVDAKAIANKFDKSIPDTSEKFLLTVYFENLDIKNSVDSNKFLLGLEGFGTYVSLKNPKKLEVEMELK